MKHWTLQLRHAPSLRLDLRALQPLVLAELNAEQVAALPVSHGNERSCVGDWFSLSVSEHTLPTLTLQGDLSRADRIGQQMAGGRLNVQGSVGDYLGAGLAAGTLHVQGDAGVLAACEMSGGLLEISGHVGDFAASALPGSMDGMRGGVLLIHGSAGERLADRMRRGSVLVFGNVGDYAASRMVAGTLALGRGIGAHLGHGMRRGSIVCASQTPQLGPTFNPMQGDLRVIWQLLARDLASVGGQHSPFADLPRRQPHRWAGDIGAGGLGEVWCL